MRQYAALLVGVGLLNALLNKDYDKYASVRMRSFQRSAHARSAGSRHGRADRPDCPAQLRPPRPLPGRRLGLRHRCAPFAPIAPHRHVGVFPEDARRCPAVRSCAVGFVGLALTFVPSAVFGFFTYQSEAANVTSFVEEAKSAVTKLVTDGKTLLEKAQAKSK